MFPFHTLNQGQFQRHDFLPVINSQIRKPLTKVSTWETRTNGTLKLMAEVSGVIKRKNGSMSHASFVSNLNQDGIPQTIEHLCSSIMHVPEHLWRLTERAKGGGIVQRG